MAIAEGFTLGLALGEGVFEATRGVTSGDAAGVDSSVVGVTVGEDAGVAMGDDAGVSIDSESLWFGVQRESINTDKTANARMTIRVFFWFDFIYDPYIHSLTTVCRIKGE